MKPVLALIAILGVAFAVTPAVADCVTGVASYDVLNVRAGPSSSRQIVFSLPPDACGIEKSGDCRDNWCHVNTDYGSGWVNARYLEGEGHGYSPENPKGDTRDLLGNSPYCVSVRSGDTLNARSGPSTDYEVVGEFSNGYCNVYGTGRCRGQWCETSNHEFTGWVHTKFLRRQH